MKIPTAQDWIDNPESALAACLEIAKDTAAHGDPTTGGIALGIASKLIRAAAPAIGQAVGGPIGALAGAAAIQLAESLNREHADVVKALTPGQISLIDQAIAIGVQAATKKVTP
jgi:hypothetical protein